MLAQLAKGGPDCGDQVRTVARPTFKAQSAVTLVTAWYLSASRSSAPQFKVRSEGGVGSSLTRQRLQSPSRDKVCSDKHRWMDHRHECRGPGPGVAHLQARAPAVQGALETAAGARGLLGQWTQQGGPGDGGHTEGHSRAGQPSDWVRLRP